MFLTAFLLSAAQLSAAVPLNLSQWFSPYDLPAFLLQQDGSWSVGVRLVIAPDGSLRGCIVTTTSGFADLDKLTCEIIRKRARFRPASWMDGSAAMGVYGTSVNWSVSPAPQSPRTRRWTADVEISVDHLPAQRKSPSLVRVMFAVDTNGAVSNCSAEPNANFVEAENDPALVPIACDAVTKNFTLLPLKDSSGQPTRSVQDALIRFSTAH